jgi:hypothetical protein
MRLQKAFLQLNVWLDKIIGLFSAEGAEATLAHVFQLCRAHVT